MFCRADAHCIAARLCALWLLVLLARPIRAQVMSSREPYLSSSDEDTEDEEEVQAVVAHDDLTLAALDVQYFVGCAMSLEQAFHQRNLY